MSLDYIKIKTNYTEETLDLVVDQFIDKTNYLKLVEIISDVQEDFNELLVQLATSRRLPVAAGEQLTEIGRQQGIIRNTEDDSDFRSAIYLSSIKRQADGTRDNIASALEQSTGNLPYIYPGLYRLVEININGDILPSQETIEEIIGLLPVNTAYHIGKTPRTGKPFGFFGNSNAGGFASELAGTSSDCGSWSSLRAYIPPPKGDSIYVQLDYVEEGYV